MACAVIRRGGHAQASLYLTVKQPLSVRSFPCVHTGAFPVIMEPWTFIETPPTGLLAHFECQRPAQCLRIWCPTIITLLHTRKTHDVAPPALFRRAAGRLLPLAVGDLEMVMRTQSHVDTSLLFPAVWCAAGGACSHPSVGIQARGREFGVGAVGEKGTGPANCSVEG